MKISAFRKAKKASAAKSNYRKVLNRDHHDPDLQLPLKEVVVRVVALAQIILGKRFYPYQVELASRIVESLLEHDGDVITSLMARQAGKTETIGGIVAAMTVILPELAIKYPNDWRLNITDDQGYYRGFRSGLKVGIYAPRRDQAEITFDRVRKAFASDTAKQVLKEANLQQDVNNGNTLVLTNKSSIRCQSASEQSKIEGATHHLLILEEAQDLSDAKVRKSLHPMVASTSGSIIKIGTASTKKGDFYNAIQENRKTQAFGGPRNHFFFPWTVCAKYNSLYRKHVEKEKVRLGESSDEFRMSYNGEWIFERGMFVVQDTLFHQDVAMVTGPFAEFALNNTPKLFRLGYSIVVGIDWGETSDSTVLCFTAVNWNNPVDSYSTNGDGVQDALLYKKHVIGFVEFQGDNYEHQFHEIMSIFSKIVGLQKVVMDSNTAGAPMLSRFQSALGPMNVSCEPFNFHQKLKSDGYKALSADLYAKRITFPAGQNARQTPEYRKFLQQMLDLRKEYKTGILSVSHPDERGAHDDYPDALMLAAYGAGIPSFNMVHTSAENPFLL